jgi:hypothetical protein
MIFKEKKMYRVRFHLQNGENYKKWQIRGKNMVQYLDPDTHTMELIGCRLVNQVNKAKKVHAAGVKDVAGWIECDDIIMGEEIDVDNLERLFYNPIVDPYWRRDADDGEFIWDGSRFATLVTKGRRVYVLEERN